MGGSGPKSNSICPSLPWSSSAYGRTSATPQDACGFSHDARRSHLKGAPRDAPLVILSDSRYVVQGATAWIHNWRRRGWRTAGGKAVANRELWEKLGAAQAIRTARTSFEWVKGHAGHPLNVRTDAAARGALRRSEGCPPGHDFEEAHMLCMRQVIDQTAVDHILVHDRLAQSRYRAELHGPYPCSRSLAYLGANGGRGRLRHTLGESEAPAPDDERCGMIQSNPVPVRVT